MPTIKLTIGGLDATINHQTPCLVKALQTHLELVHQNSKARFVCQFRHSCQRDFPRFSIHKNHVKDSHKKRESHVGIRQNQLVEQLSRPECAESSCGHQSMSRIKLLKQHLYSHTDRKEEVQCIFCSYRQTQLELFNLTFPGNIKFRQFIS